MKTYYVRSRTGEIRPITTKAFIYPTLRTDRKRPEFPRIQHCTSSWPRWLRSIPADERKNRQVATFCIYEWALKSFLSNLKSRTHVGAAMCVLVGTMTVISSESLKRKFRCMISVIFVQWMRQYWLSWTETRSRLAGIIKLGETCGYEKWHRRFGHTSNKDI